ncbi:MAG: phage major capsid protein [Erythrobacteraceae bacterium]|nr:phage major capsid protein [Erythrobacteraceae bacterium]
MKTPKLIELERQRLDLIAAARAALTAIRSNTNSAKADELEARHDDIMRQFDMNGLDIEAEKMVADEVDQRASYRPNLGSAEAFGVDAPGAYLVGARSAWVDQRGEPVKVLGKGEPMAERSESRVGLGDLVRAKITGARNDAEARALSAGTDSAGGFSVPDITAREFIDRLRARSVVMQAGAMTVPMESGTLSIARLETDPDSAWRAENAAVAEGDPTFGRVLFSAKTLAGKVTISRELAQDSLNVGSMIETAFAQSMAVELDRAALYGTGTSNAPTGVWHTSGINAVSMGTNGAALADYDDLLDTLLALKNSNAADPTAMVANPRTEIALAKLKDADGNPLVPPAMVGRIPLLSTTSAPIDETEGTAENASSIVFGDFRDLMIGMRQQLEIRIYDQPLAGTGQLLVVAWMRADVQLAKPKSFAKLTGIIPAA